VGSYGAINYKAIAASMSYFSFSSSIRLLLLEALEYTEKNDHEKNK
jgi:hypothetical protein